MSEEKNIAWVGLLFTEVESSLFLFYYYYIFFCCPS